MQKDNPLRSHFRQPAVYLKLPSGGKYWTPNSINLPANGEIGIMPMTAKDEIMLRTPDALMNGQGVVSVIQSCVPAIVNAWGMPTIDLDAILIAIRIATYGEGMDMESECPACKHESRHELQLGQVLTRIRSPNYDDMFTVDDLTFKFKPINYIQSTKNNINILSLSTESITTSSGEVVSDKNLIGEFYSNATNKTIKAVQAKLKEFADYAALPPARVQCEECDNQYNVNVTFDYANFFEPLS